MQMEKRQIKITVYLMVSVAALMGAATSHAASFDCAKATTAVEKMICADAHASILDEYLNSIYRVALSESSDQIQLQLETGQSDWLKKRDACVDADCIVRSYASRIDSISAFARKYPELYEAKMYEIQRKKYGPYSGLPNLRWKINKIYKDALAKSRDSEKLKADQARWLKELNSCKDVVCLERMYHARLFVLAPLVYEIPAEAVVLTDE